MKDDSLYLRHIREAIRRIQENPSSGYEVRIPNASTREALHDAAERRNMSTFGSTDALFADLGI